MKNYKIEIEINDLPIYYTARMLEDDIVRGIGYKPDKISVKEIPNANKDGKQKRNSK